MVTAVSSGSREGFHQADAAAAARFELASPAWMAAMIETIETLLAEVDLGTAVFTMGETFTDLPDHIAANDGDDFSWHLRVTGKSVKVLSGRPEMDLNLRFILSYPVGATLARMVYGDDPAVHAERDRLVGTAIRDGRIRTIGQIADMPPQVEAGMSQVHDKMAVRTC